MDTVRNIPAVSDAEARTLTAARRVLVEIGRRAADYYQADPNLAWRLGGLHEGAERAEAGLFEMLNHAANMLDCKAAQAACRENVYV